MNREEAELYRLIKRYRLDWRHPKELKFVLKRLERGRLQPWQARRWIRKMQPWIKQQEECFNPFPPAPDQDKLGQFDIEVGELIENPGVRAGIRVLDRPRHVLVAGGTGSGKSNILRKIVNGLNELIRLRGKKMSILILDFKGDFVDVPKRLGRDLWDHYSTTDGFRISCSPPSDCLEQRSWINKFTEVFATHCDLKYGESCLASVMGIAYDILNKAMRKPFSWPALSLIDKLAKVLPTKLIARKPQYQESLVQQTSYLLRNTGSLFDASQGFDIIEHLIKSGRCAVIHCPELSQKAACILVNLLASYLLYSKISHRLTLDTTEFVLVVDESDAVCSIESSKCYPEGYSPLGQLLKQGREFGVMVCLGMSSLCNCSQFITSNTTYHFILYQGDSASATEAARTLMEPDSRQLVGSLRCGECIYREAMGPVRYGMLVKADYVEPARIPRPDKFDQHPYVPAKKLEELPALREAVNKIREKYNVTILRQSNQSQQNKQKSGNQKLSKKARAFLSFVSVYEYEPGNILFKRMEKISGKTQMKIIEELVDLKLIESKIFRKSNSSARLVRITQEGWAYLKDHSKYKPLRGGIIHSHICRWIEWVAKRRGYEKPACEWKIPGTNGFCDVAYKINDRWHCVEVVVDCETNIEQHVKNCFIESNVVETLTIVTTQKKDEWNKVQDKIMSNPELVFFLNRIKLDIADTYYKELWCNGSI